LSFSNLAELLFDQIKLIYGYTFVRLELQLEVAVFHAFYFGLFITTEYVDVGKSILGHTLGIRFLQTRIAVIKIVSSL